MAVLVRLCCGLSVSLRIDTSVNLATMGADDLRIMVRHFTQESRQTFTAALAKHIVFIDIHNSEAYPKLTLLPVATQFLEFHCFTLNQRYRPFSSSM
jgi:hypothetical protein